MPKLRCILLVDDDPTTNYLNRKLLEKLDVTDHILTALNGQEALQVLANGCDSTGAGPACPVLIFLDVNMPLMSGFEFLDAYQQLPLARQQAIVIVMLTTSMHPRDLQHLFGYARVSASDQNLDTQLDDLTRAGCSRIFQEKVSGTRTRSLVLDELLATVREDDVVVVNRLARLGRNTVHTIQLVEEFNRRGVHFRALDLGIDSRTPAGKMIIGVFSSFNQYERENNRQKSLAGIELAKQQGKHLGRPAGRNAEKLAKVAKALAKGLSVTEIVTLTGISRASVKRYRHELAVDSLPPAPASR